MGIISFGALSVGCFSTGALAIGKYLAIGDHARAYVAIGKTVAEGSVYSHIGDLSTVDMSKVTQALNTHVPSWLNWAKALFEWAVG